MSEKITIATLSASLTKNEISLIDKYYSPDERLQDIFTDIDAGNYSDYEIMIYIYSLFKENIALKAQLAENTASVWIKACEDLSVANNKLEQQLAEAVNIIEILLGCNDCTDTEMCDCDETVCPAKQFLQSLKEKEI